MKLSKTKKIILLTAGLAVLTTSIVTPIVILNKDEKNKENDVEKLFKILKAKTTKEKIIELPSGASGKIIANNQEKIIEKIKALIGTSNLKEIKIEVSMQSDTNISTTPQKITIKLTKNKISKEIKDFSVKRNFTADEDIMAIKNILAIKNRNNDPNLLITLSSSFSGSITNNSIIKKTIERKVKIAIDPSNVNGDPDHPSLRGTTITFTRMAFDNDDLISTFFRPFVITISKPGGKSLEFINFLVRKARN